MKALVGAPLVLALVAGCSATGIRGPSHVVTTSGGAALVLHRLPRDLDVASVRVRFRLRLIGGRFGCLGLVRGIEDVVVVFPPESHVVRSATDGPRVTLAGTTYGVGDVVVGAPWNPEPAPLAQLTRFDRAVPTNCRGFRAQAFVTLTR